VSELRVVTEALGGSTLANAVAAASAPVDWYPPRPRHAAAWRDRMARIGQERPGWLAALRAAFGTGAAIDRLERTAAAGGVVVTTGQQPGLFGGPIYTWEKALSALALADALERATGVAAAPVFWAATDDADFAEASVTHVAVPGGLDTLRAPDQPAAAGLPMARVPLGDVRPLLERLRRGAGSAANTAAVGAAERAYTAPGATVGGAYLALLRELLEPLGIAVLDASDPAVRRAGAALMRRALVEGAAIDEALADRERALTRAGHPLQVAPVADLTLVFETAPDGTKQRVPRSRATAVAAGASDDALGPNVLLRPVLERSVLPTVAYVAGPGELAYFAQVSAVAAALGVEPPLAVPRWSATIVEPHVRRLLDRLGLDADALRDPHAAETRLARAAMPAPLRDALGAARRVAADAVRAIAAAPGSDALPPTVVDGAATVVGARLARLERRYTAQFKRRETELMRDVSTARAALWPLGSRQERALNFIPLLARHGPALIAAMRSEAGATMERLVGRGGGAGVDAGR
jgi:bacillithiol biosynthesis cysteine-adding enzyme BshC